MPAFLILISEKLKHENIFCSVLEFTAEEEKIYLPL